MFAKDSFVFHESGGICRVADICPAPLEGMPSDRVYYTLKPLHDPASVIYLPVDSEAIFLRALLSREEAEAFLSRAAQIEIIEEPNAKQLRNKYIESMRCHTPDEWVRVIKTVNHRISLITSPSRRISDSERGFAETARRNLITELSIVLELSAADTEATVKEKLCV